YCCQGDRSLESAIEEAGLTPDFIAELQSAYSDYLASPKKELPVSELNDEELIDHILDTHHLEERALWKELDKLVNLILIVHYDHGKELLLKLHRSFSELKMELEEHFVKEEKELFPAMLKEDKTPEDLAAIRSLIRELEGEHDVAGIIIKRLIKESNHFTPPEYACPTMKTFFRKLHELVDDIFLHIAKENSVLLKRYQ
ncbi:MAG: iron-sulfur cluster repair di-iron protein, partial [Syntrophomonadaceae bacterium]|nr:iron-sulfur cluster repair di-iron protein [Syntrophomonadaceae bacterium]